ncbi:MAG: response regulator, partial [Candidatus Omnitrophica bacterium]|nr:response regulator [Candidatus Omnitrophota bacterium]
MKFCALSRHKIGEKMKEKILVVEDEKDIAKMLEYNLAKEGFRIVIVNNGENALAAVKKERPDMIILDLM